MYLYFDSSSFIKKYIEEAGTAKTIELLSTAEQVYLSKISYAEVLMSLRRKQHEKTLTAETISQLLIQFHTDWLKANIVDLTDDILDIISTRIYRLPPINSAYLRALDAIHLASAMFLKYKGIKIVFVVSDSNLKFFARHADLKIIDPAEEV